MVDRQDIDALLISALYGELTPADEARLTTHLESHPQDRSALADLTLTRSAVRESRFLTVQLEPPQAISALLLQEATRGSKSAVNAREPVAQDGWFTRFVRSFAAHPAIGAAAMLVLVVGVAGTMYVRNGGHSVAEQTTSTFGDHGVAAGAAPAMEPATTTAPIEAKKLEERAGSSYEADLADPHAGLALDGVGNQETGRSKGTANGKADKAEAQIASDNDNKPTPKRTYLQTQSRPAPKPMDIGGKDDVTAIATPDDTYRVTKRPTGAPTRQTPPAVVVVDGRGPPSNDPAAPPPAKTASRGGEDQKEKDGKSVAVDAETQWARDQHVKVGNAVRANNCKEATTIAVSISNRTPAYFQQNVETDRSLKQCMTYINAEREKEADRQQRARALQKRNADESARNKTTAPAASTK